MPDERSQGSPGITQITELIRQAERFGLTWGRRPGTVVSVSDPYTPTQASVRMDGDDVEVTVVSLTGNLSPGFRVMVDRVPPAGLYAIAIIDPPPTPFTAVSRTDSATITAEAVTLTISRAELRQGTAYQFNAGTLIVGASATPGTYRVRKGSTVAGTLWAVGPGFQGLGVIGSSAQWVGFLTPTVDMSTAISLTISASLLGVVHTGNALTPRFFSVRPVGIASDFPQCVSVT
jgi:hypothetical protein